MVLHLQLMFVAENYLKVFFRWKNNLSVWLPKSPFFILFDLQRNCAVHEGNYNILPLLKFGFTLAHAQKNDPCLHQHGYEFLNFL